MRNDLPYQSRIGSKLEADIIYAESIAVFWEGKNYSALPAAAAAAGDALLMLRDGYSTQAVFHLSLSSADDDVNATRAQSLDFSSRKLSSDLS